MIVLIKTDGIVLDVRHVADKAAAVALMAELEKSLQAQLGPQVKLNLKGGNK